MGYVKKVNDKIVEKKEKELMNKAKPTTKTEEKQENKPKSEIDKVIDEWDKKDLSRVLYYYDSDVYDKIQIIVTREMKRKKFIMPFDLLVSQKNIIIKLLNIIVKTRIIKKVWIFYIKEFTQ
jgi:hypothetical protein